MKIIYDLLDKKLQNYYVKYNIVLTTILVFFALFISFLTLLLKTQILYICLIISSSLAMLSIFCMIFCIKHYGKKISIESDCIKVFNFKGKFLYSYDLSNKKVIEKKVEFRIYISDNQEERCLIFYDEFDVHQKIKFHENRSNKDILIIQNPQFIEMWKELNKS